jgi:serine/threonine-protein phosphatase 4 regulatory subunit 2
MAVKNGLDYGILSSSNFKEYVTTAWSFHVFSLAAHQNICIFLDDPELSSPKTAPPFTNRPTTAGGLKVPPARPRARNPANLMVATKSFMSKSEANDIKESIFAQLHEFEK